jgi:hypothetical protein
MQSTIALNTVKFGATKINAPFTFTFLSLSFHSVPIQCPFSEHAVAIDRYSFKEGEGRSPKEILIGPQLPREDAVTLIVRPAGGEAALQSLLALNAVQHPGVKALKMANRLVAVTHHALKAFRTCESQKYHRQVNKTNQYELLGFQDRVSSITFLIRVGWDPHFVGPKP